MCKTFIVEEVGYDLFPMTWQRVESIAEFNEYLTPCLANVKILYCNSEEDRKKFEELQNKLKNNLNNKVFMLEKASEKMKAVFKIYQTMLFEDDLCELRVFAGQVVMHLSDAVAYANKTYFSHGLKKQIDDLKKMQSTPEDYVSLYESVVKANSEIQLRDYCYKIIKNTKSYLDHRNIKMKEEKKKVKYEELAEFFEEAISTWNKIKICCDNGNSILAYISRVCLQRKLNNVSREIGLHKFDLMSYYDATLLEKFKERAIEIQKEIVRIIEESGIHIEKYDPVKESFGKK